MGEASNRKKARRSRLVSYGDFKRRVITDPKEIDQIEHEQADDQIRIAQEKKEEREAARWDDTATSKVQNETMEAWEPPRSRRDFYFLAAQAFPDWGDAARWKWANIMYRRRSFIETAVLQGLDRGRNLRERFKRKLGWDWPALAPLAPAEREFVLNFVRRKVCGDLLRATVN
jgi:hypothetical protein